VTDWSGPSGPTSVLLIFNSSTNSYTDQMILFYSFLEWVSLELQNKWMTIIEWLIDSVYKQIIFNLTHHCAHQSHPYKKTSLAYLLFINIP